MWKVILWFVIMFFSGVCHAWYVDIVPPAEDEVQRCIPLNRWIQYAQPCFKQGDITENDYIIWDWNNDNSEHKHLINYAYKLWWMDFVKTLGAECVSRDIDCYNKNTDGTVDRWLCQLNYSWHSSFIDSEDFLNPYIQLRYCYDVWNDALYKNWIKRLRTTFYGYNVRSRQKNLFYLEI